MKTVKKNESKTKKWKELKELNRLTEKEHQDIYDSYYDDSYYDLISSYKNEYNERGTY